MAFARVVAAWAAILAVFTLWKVIEHRAQRREDPLGSALRQSVRVLPVEAGLLALLAGLWFASLGSGSGWLVFLLVGLLVELPPSLRTRAEMGNSIGWAALTGRVARIVLAAMAGGVVLTW